VKDLKKKATPTNADMVTFRAAKGLAIHVFFLQFGPIDGPE